MSQRTLRAAARFLVLLLGVALVWSCGGDKKSATNAPPQSESAGTDIPADFVLFTSPNRGYTIAHPRHWEASDDYIKIGETGGDAFISPDVEDGFKANVNVIREEIPDGMSPEEYFETTLTVLNAQLSVDPEAGDDVTIAGEQARTLSYSADTGAVRYDVNQAIVVARGSAWIFTLSTAEGMAEDYLQTFKAMYGSFVIN